VGRRGGGSRSAPRPPPLTVCLWWGMVRWMHSCRLQALQGQGLAVQGLATAPLLPSAPPRPAPL
jgi:hypothetical protein